MESSLESEIESDARKCIFVVKYEAEIHTYIHNLFEMKL